MTDNKQRMPSDAKSPHCLWHGELKRILKCEYLHVITNVQYKHVTLYQHQSIFKGDNGKSYLSFNSLGKSYLSFNREDFFRNQTIRNKNCLWQPCLLTDRAKMTNLYRGPSIDASYQVSVHLDKRFQRKRFLKIRNKDCLWRPCLLMDRDKVSNLYRGPSIDASYQISIHLGKWFQRR